jgi:hypothetical protein
VSLSGAEPLIRFHRLVLRMAYRQTKYLAILFVEENQAWQLLSLKPHHLYSGRSHGQSARD